MYDLFSDFFGGFDVYPVYRTEAKCKKCGRSYSEFRNSGKFGCSECYNAFKAPVDVTLKQIHSVVEHKGKIPKNAGAGIAKKKHIEDLKTKIAEAVSKEDYETAALLHKELKTLSE